ncbi:Archaeal Lon protease [uncultured archaeon]|nr:Archaeal Lon protease [uncultured archaeon]
MGFSFDFEDTSKLSVPASLLEQVIGQDEAVRLAKLISKQRRNLLLVGPPGTGKSMIAQAIATLLPAPAQEVSVLHNPAKPERPFLEVRTRAQIRQAAEALGKPGGTLLQPEQVPSFVSERLGLRCRACGRFSSADDETCPACGKQKFRLPAGPFDDLVAAPDEPEREDMVHTTRVMDGKEDLVVFERVEGGLIRALEGKEMARLQKSDAQLPRNVLLGVERPAFVQATGASETELLGDVRHDPYGGHQQIGTPPYTRVVAGAVHEAHEGVLFVDELISLGRLQRHLLTAMQEKKFPITGRNASSTGASVRVDGVPCDFILVAAVNTSDVRRILSPLRSRIAGNGYELLVNATMPDTEENRMKLARFCAQEIRRDGRIPHADANAVEKMVEEARRRARAVDQTAGLSLRLRALSGVLKTAGDLAVSEGAPLISAKHVQSAIERGKPIEEQIASRYGTAYRAAMSDLGVSRSNTEDKSIG